MAYIAHKRHGIGRISILRGEEETNIFTLTDLVIFDPSLIPIPWWKKRTPFLPWSPPDYRQKGLGKAMLQYVIAYCEMRGAIAIEGEITVGDANETPYLHEFYQKSGFEVSPSTKSGVSARLYKKLDPATTN